MGQEFESILNTLGDAVFTQAEALIGTGNWSGAYLDVRFNKEEESWLGKIRATRADGNTASLALNNEISLSLIDLEQFQGQEWYGILLTISPDRRCVVKVNYDPNCTADDTFYDT